MIDNQIKYKATNNQVSSTISDATVILNHKEGIYYELNEVGSVIWELLKVKPITFYELKDLIINEFEVDESLADVDINRILNELLDEKLVEIV
ncbi:MAG: PqqD family protein [Emticicia sp.]|uniref:PqqD family protein n=1 Tax=Emticicia sp. TaxID=1930953 RepID=UPI003BA40443